MILLLGGTADAAHLADHLAPHWPLIVSLAGRTEQPRPLAANVRIGGFGGVAGLAHYLAEHKIKAVIDATHPFAARMAANARAACAETGIPLIKWVRPAWERQTGDDWHLFPDGEAAARWVANWPGVAFLTVGRQALASFLARPPKRALVRLLKPEDLGVPGWSVVVGRPPFSEAEEIATFRTHGIDLLVSKASGGTQTETKIEAARRLNIKVALIERPEISAPMQASSFEQITAWLAAQ